MNYEIETPASLYEELKTLPKGTIVYKPISGTKRPYLQWKEAGKTKNKYLKQDEIEKVQALIDRRKVIEAKLKEQEFKFHDESKAVYSAYTYKTNVVKGEMLTSFISDVKDFEKRDCFSIVSGYISGPKKDMICALYGLRRTGKTVMLKQAISEIADYVNSAAYIKLRTSDDMEGLNADIKHLQAKGVKYLFLDEITLMENFIDGSSLLSDVFAATGMKIIVSGTDSLGFWLSSSNELYDRVILVHTTHVSYKEHRRLLGIKDIDEYIKYGGTLRAGELNFDDTINIKDASFKDDESARRYIDTAIAYNIQNSLKYFKGGYFRNLQSLYEAGELTNAINRVVEHNNHEFTANVITKIFKSADLGSASQLAMNSPDSNRRTDILSKVDKDKVTSNLMRILDIRNKFSVEVEDHQLVAIKEYLKALDLFAEVNVSYLGDAPATKRNIITLPGLRFCQAQALIAMLDNDEAFGKADKRTKALVKEIIEEDVSGKILEEIVLLETQQRILQNNLNFEVGKISFVDGEIDMYVFDSDKCVCDLFEIKHSKEINSKQQRHLLNEEKLAKVKSYFGEVGSLNVIFRGPSTILDNGIRYINAEEFLTNKTI